MFVDYWPYLCSVLILCAVTSENLLAVAVDFFHCLICCYTLKCADHAIQNDLIDFHVQVIDSFVVLRFYDLMCADHVNPCLKG